MGLVDPRDVGDFFGPTFEVQLTSLQGNDITTVKFDNGLTTPDLSFFPGTTVVNPVETVSNIHKSEGINDLVLKINASLTAESKAGSPFHIVLTMTPEYEDGLELLNTRAFGYATIARVRWGYTSYSGEPLLTEWHTFRNIQPKAKFAENIQIILDGWDMFSDVAARRTLTLNRGESSLAFIEKLAKRVGYEVSLAENLKTHAINDPPKYKRQQQLTDFQLVKRLLREAQLTFAIRGSPDGAGGVIDIYDPKTSRLKGDVDYTFKWRQELTSPRDIPVISMDANFLQYFFQPPAGRGLKSISTNPETGKTKVHDSVAGGATETPSTGTTDMLSAGPTSSVKDTDQTVTDEGGNPVTQVPGKSTESEETGTTITFPSNDNVEDIAGIGITIAKETEILSSPILKIKAPGVPDMFPGLQVKVEGMADAFDGVYNVLTTKHYVSNSGYEMDVELIRWTTRSPDVGSPGPGLDPTDQAPTATPDSSGFLDAHSSK